jgi:site-specific DNA-methyltransferase (adenine-specific)
MTVENYYGINHMDCIEGMRALPSECAQVVVCDPPYNIGKDFGNTSDKQEFNKYIEWCKEWVAECVRILKPRGTLYIYGFSEILAHIQVTSLPTSPQLKVRWLIWHYTNKNIPSAKFWQRSHESILCIYKNEHGPPIFNLDDVREPYTDTFLKNAAGKTRKATPGRFSSSNTETTYTAHEKGALPRDVIKIPALAGGAGMKERVDHPTQKPIELCLKLLKASQDDNGNDNDNDHDHTHAQNTRSRSLVVIPFTGSGSECVACVKMGLDYIGFEINETYVDLANTRICDTYSEQD